MLFPLVWMRVFSVLRHSREAFRFCAVVSAWSHCFLSSSCMIWFCCVSCMPSWFRIPRSMPMCPILR